MRNIKFKGHRTRN